MRLLLQYIRMFSRGKIFFLLFRLKFAFRMLLTRAVRPDRLITTAKSFVGTVFGSEFVQKADALLNLEQIIDDEVRNNRPRHV